MPKTVVTKEIEDFILKNRLKIASNKIGAKFGISGTAVRYFLKKKGLLLSKAESIKISSESRRGRTSFTKKEDDFIKKNYLTMPIKTMERSIGRSFCGIHGRLKSLGLVIPPEIVAQRVLDSTFKKGQIPANKGKKMSPEQKEKCKHTFFQKGHLPGNTIGEVGAISIRTYGVRNGDSSYKIQYIQHEYLKWKPLHIHNWENQNGQVPKGFCLWFKDGNQMNAEVENLELITRKENMQRNSIQRYPEEVRQVMQMRGAINRQINKKEKKHEQ